MTWIDDLKIEGAKEKLVHEVKSIAYDIRCEADKISGYDREASRTSITVISEKVAEVNELLNALEEYEIP